MKQSIYKRSFASFNLLKYKFVNVLGKYLKILINFSVKSPKKWRNILFRFYPSQYEEKLLRIDEFIV